MMKPFRSMMPLHEALAIAQEAVVPIARTEHVALDAAHGRVLASAILAPRDVPSFDRSAMDGYALVAADTRGASRDRPATLALAGRVYAGDAADLAITPGACLEVATGAPIPPGADAVVMVEETSGANAAGSGGASTPSSSERESVERELSEGRSSERELSAKKPSEEASSERGSSEPRAGRETIQVFVEVRPGQHVVRRGADMHQGDPIAGAGGVLEPGRIGALAAIGLAAVEVFAKPIVAILPTGNEVVSPGQPLPPGHVYDVNRYTLGALVERHGGIPRQLPTVGDTREGVRDALARATGAQPSPDGPPADLLIVCGGSSVGERDLVIDALREQGEVLFHGLAVKPGKPTACARLGNTLVLGMPGNPTSCLSNAYVLMIPLLRALARLPPQRPTVLRRTLAERVTSPAGKIQFLPVRLLDDRATPTFKGSGEITSLSQADGYVTIAADVELLDAGTPVDVTLY